MGLFIAVDMDGDIFMYGHKPVRRREESVWVAAEDDTFDMTTIRQEDMPFELNGMSWFDEPVEVEIVPKHRPLGELRTSEDTSFNT